MIVRDRPTFLQLFFILRGSIVTRIFPQILTTAGLSALVVYGHEVRPAWVPAYSGAPFALLGIALSVFLGFRNNACYDRWWEARRHWGELLAAARTLDRQSLVLAPETRRRLLTLTIAFTHHLVLHLRPGGKEDKAARHLTEGDRAILAASGNRPHTLLRLMSQTLTDNRAAGALGDIPYQSLDRTVETMGMVLASCERLRSTPIPFGYTLLLHRTAYLFCFLLPFGFANVLGWATPFATALVAYTFFGLDALGDELEEPFGNRENDLPIGAIADLIEIGLLEGLGEKDLPPVPAPVKHLLL